MITAIIPALVKDKKLYDLTLKSVSSIISYTPNVRVYLYTNGEHTGIEEKFARDFCTLFPSHVCKHFYPEFNMNAVFNMGVRDSKHTGSKWIILSNNDIIFKDDWLDRRMMARSDMIIPATTRTGKGAKEFKEGCEMTESLPERIQWALPDFSLSMIRRKFITKHPLDERFWFFGQDNCMVRAVIDSGGVVYKINTCAVIEHIARSTRLTLTKAERDALHKKTDYRLIEKYRTGMEKI